VSSAKSTYDNTRGQVILLSAKISFLDRVLVSYGPETTEVRRQLHAAVEEAVRQMWPGNAGLPAKLTPNTRAGDVIYDTIESLSPRDDTQRNLKAQAATLNMEIGQLRMLLLAQSVVSVSKPLLVVVILWLMIIFTCFSLLAPPNPTAKLALIVSALSVASAIFLILEMDRPFGGLISVPSRSMLDALSELGR
jgi:hypothetical protein